MKSTEFEDEASITLSDRALSNKEEQIHVYEARSATFPSVNEQRDVEGDTLVFLAPARTIAHADATLRGPLLLLSIQDVGVPKINLRDSSTCTALGAANSVPFARKVALTAAKASSLPSRDGRISARILKRERCARTKD